MKVERSGEKDVRVVKQGNIFNPEFVDKRKNARPRMSPDGYPPMVCGPMSRGGWGKLTWRKPTSDKTRILHFAQFDLCQIGYELTHGFHQYSDMSYRVFSTEQTWVKERQYHLLDDEFDLDLLHDAVDMADIIVVNTDHYPPFLHRQSMQGKKMVIYHHGPPYREEYKQLNKLETAAGYGRLVSTPDLLRLDKNLTWLPCPINVREFDALYNNWNKSSRGPLQIAHSFTISSNKGTPEFANIVNKMTSDGEPIKLGLIHLVNRQVSLHLLSQADVYFATYLYGPGLATIEAMTLGIPALVGCTKEELKWQMSAIGVTKVEDLPWIYVTPETTADILRELQDPKVRKHWAEKGRDYVERFHDIRVVVKRLEDFCQSLEPAKGVIRVSGKQDPKNANKVIWERRLRMFGEPESEAEADAEATVKPTVKPATKKSRVVRVSPKKKSGRNGN